MPNSLLHPTDQLIRPGLLGIGDVWNMRHPLTGGGMTVALSDVCIIRDLLSKMRGKNLEDRKFVSRELQSFYVTRKPLAVTINILACALHSVFSASEDPVLPFMRQGCFEYFKLGGACVDGPMSLLSALNPKPHVLLTHFFLVGLYGAMRSMWPPWPSNIVRAYKIMKAAAWIVLPLMSGEKVFFLFRTLLFILFYKSQRK